MRKSIARTGSLFLICGTFMFSIVFYALASFVPHSLGYSTPPGKLLSLLEDSLLMLPFTVSIIFMAIGCCLLAIELYLLIPKSKYENAYLEGASEAVDDK